MGDLTREGENLVRDWLCAKQEVARLKAALNRAECDEVNAQIALAKWLMPSDMKVGEKIGVWQGDSLFQVEKRESGDTVVTVRTRGTKFHMLAA
jgi:hypothetical protein